MAWEQTLAWTLMAIIGVWGVGTLLSFAVNRMQIVSVAEQAHALVEHPSVSDYQLTALHTLRNDAGRLLHRVREGAPWYQRFGLDHNPQLLNAMLPWYGVVNNRLIRDPANVALTQKLSALANSAPNSDQRAQLAKPGYDQLKAWLMMARPDKADGAFYAQTMKWCSRREWASQPVVAKPVAGFVGLLHLRTAKAATVENHAGCAAGQPEPPGAVAANWAPQCRKHAENMLKSVRRNLPMCLWKT
jgi:type VI protein secretion system component VasK